MTGTDLVQTYKSFSTIQLVQLRLENGLTDDARPVLEAELQSRGIDPHDVNEGYLDELLVKAGRPEGIKALSAGDPLWGQLRRLERLKAFATKHPVLFSLSIGVIVPLGISAVWLVVLPWAEAESPVLKEFQRYSLHILFALASTYILWRFGWLRSAGFLSAGRLRTWLVMVLFLVIEIALFSMVMLGDPFSPMEALPWRGIWERVPESAVYFLIGGTVEELIYRGIVLYALLRIYGQSRRGLFWSVVVSAVLFGLLHLFGGSLTKVLFATLAGFFYGALLVHGRSIWIPVVSHSLSNLALTVLSWLPFYYDSSPADVLFYLAHLPAVACAFYLIVVSRPREVVPAAP